MILKLVFVISEVLIKMGCVGICGTDIEIFSRGGMLGHLLKLPIALGHEGAGVVQECGSDIHHLKPGI